MNLVPSSIVGLWSNMLIFSSLAKIHWSNLWMISSSNWETNFRYLKKYFQSIYPNFNKIWFMATYVSSGSSWREWISRRTLNLTLFSHSLLIYLNSLGKSWNSGLKLVQRIFAPGSSMRKISPNPPIKSIAEVISINQNSSPMYRRFCRATPSFNP